MGSLVQLGNHAQFRNGGTFGVPLILNRLSARSDASFSLRKINADYSGFAIRVRRSSDNAELNIGFLYNELDTDTLVNFAGLGNAFVTTWYDQSGNVRHATQNLLTNQPAIVTSGVVEKLNGRPAVKFDAVMQTLLTNINTPNGALTTRNVVYNGSGALATYIAASSTTPRSYLVANGQINFGNAFTGTINPANTPMVLTGIANSSSSQTQSLNGVLNTAATARSGNTPGLTIGAFALGNGHVTGHIGEINIFPTALSTTDRQLLERNQGQFYGITVI